MKDFLLSYIARRTIVLVVSLDQNAYLSIMLTKRSGPMLIDPYVRMNCSNIIAICFRISSSSSLPIVPITTIKTRNQSMQHYKDTR